MQCSVITEKLTLHLYAGPYLNKRYYSLPRVDMYAGLHLYTVYFIVGLLAVKRTTSLLQSN